MLLAWVDLLFSPPLSLHWEPLARNKGGKVHICLAEGLALTLKTLGRWGGRAPDPEVA